MNPTPEPSSEILEMCQKAIDMLRLTGEAFRRLDSRPLDQADKLGRDIHHREKELTQQIAVRLAGQGSAPHAEAEFYLVPMHLERVGDNIEFLVRAIRALIKEGTPLSERAMKEVNALFEKGIELLECTRDALGTRNKVLIRHLLQEGPRYEQMVSEFALFHQERLIKGLCAPKSSSVYLAILDYLKGIESHVRLTAQKLSSTPRGKESAP